MTIPADQPGEADATEIDRLARYCNVSDATRRPFLADCWAEAVALVDEYLRKPEGGQWEVPAPLLRRSRLMVASELYHQANAPGGIMQQWTDVQAAPARMARNPMVAAYPLLRPFVPGGFA